MKPESTNSDAALVQPGSFDEETARAEVYGLLAALYYAPPAADLTKQPKSTKALR